MQYKAFQNISLSRLGMGVMRLPVCADVEDKPVDQVKGQEIIDRALTLGINYFDTAYTYNNGGSEKFLGPALNKHDRSSCCIAPKSFIHANADYAAVLEEQLARLQTSYIDFYLLHSVTDKTADDYLNSGCIDYFLEQKRLGRIRHLGFSSHASPDTLARFAAHHDWDFVQIQLNYFDWQYGTAKAEYEILERHNIPIMVMEPVRGGRLASLTPETEAILKQAHPDWSIASWALRFVIGLPQVQVILSGMSDLSQLEDNVVTFSSGIGLCKEDYELLMDVCEKFRSQVQIPCTGCRYCCDGCPAQINIPEFLKIYNSYKVDGPFALNAMENVDSVGKPADCIGCGNCTAHCPQDLDVPKLMQALAEAAAK